MKNIYNRNLGYWIKHYLLDHLPIVRNLSRNTILSYRDALRQLLNYMSSKKYDIENADVEAITSTIVKDFLVYLEHEMHCSVSTRNQRLAAIHSFASYVASQSPEHLHWYHTLKSIPIKRRQIKEIGGRAVPQIEYLEKDEMQAMLNAPDRRTAQGYRDYALLLFMYNTGVRASEAVSIIIEDLKIGKGISSPYVIIHGKGNKTRSCPLWERTVKTISPLLNRESCAPVFLNRYGNAITRFGIYELVSRYAVKASEIKESIREKHVSPHTIRHTTASHLLEAGVDINTIRAWLGHVSVNTTNIYAEVNLRMKAEALKTCEIGETSSTKPIWKKDKSLLDFLMSI